MTNVVGFRCDGCGQVASPEHTAQRLRRLEWATRYRPVHIRALLLGAVSSREDAEFLYSPGGEFRGEAGLLVRAVGISPEGKVAEAVQAEFQAAGFFLAHVLECPLEDGLGPAYDRHSDATGEERFLAALRSVRNDEKEKDGDEQADRRREAASTNATELLRERLPFVASRIRRSLKPKCVILVTEALEPLVQDIVSLDLGCPVNLNYGKPFDFSGSAGAQEFLQFREALPGSMGGNQSLRA